MKKIFIIFSLPWILIVSCKKDKAEPPAIEIKFSPEALSWVQLPLNKYFIYKDSASGTLDSVVVRESSLLNTFVPEYNCSWCISNSAYNYQSFSLKLTNLTTLPNQNWYSESATSTLGGISIFATDSAFLYLSGTFWHPYYLNTSGNSLSQMNFLSPLDVEGKTYTNVLQFINSNTHDITSASYKKTNYYWAKGIGIIKREIRTSTTVKTELLVRHG